MSSYDGGTFRIELRWKEEVRYLEGDRSVVFPAGWGMNPPVLHVPLRTWDESVPSWLRGRRDEVVERLRRHSKHTVEERDATGEVRIPTPSLSLDEFLAQLGSGL
jgi:hypothetical protein